MLAPMLLALAVMRQAAAMTTTLDGDSCSAKCTAQGHCCAGMTSACQKPSCAQACTAATQLKSEAACNATCTASVAGGAKGSNHCVYPVPKTNLTFNMCGSCQAEPAPSWWPKSVTPPNGQASEAP